ncbi:MAG: hypothetical protein WBX38_04960, partial [Candidatus Sulfotelmatobacter sp.]
MTYATFGSPRMLVSCRKTTLRSAVTAEAWAKTIRVFSWPEVGFWEIRNDKRADGQETLEWLTLLPRPKEAVAMARKAKGKRKRAPKTILKLPDLEQSKLAVLNSLTSPSSQRSYDHAIREFIDWYCSEPRLAFN